MTQFNVIFSDGFSQEIVASNLSLSAARKKVFKLAKGNADAASGDWQYSFETNSRSIYFHSDDRNGVKKILVGRLGDDSIEHSGYKWEIV
jgi:hypothetical protein